MPSTRETGVAWDLKMRILPPRSYARSANGWDDLDFERLSEAIEFDRIGCRLEMAEISQGTELNEEPTV